MKRLFILSIALSVACLTLGTSLPLLAEGAVAAKPESRKKEAPKPAPVVPPKTPPPRAGVRRPVRREPAPSVRNEYAKPQVDSAAVRRTPVVWDRSWANPVAVEWEDAPPPKPPVMEAKAPNLTEELVAIRKTLEELTQLVRALAPHQTGE